VDALEVPHLGVAHQVDAAPGTRHFVLSDRAPTDSMLAAIPGTPTPFG
jgi:hypothetical protein